MNVSLKILLEADWDIEPMTELVCRMIDPGDEVVTKNSTYFEETGWSKDIDLVIVNVCGSTPLARYIADARIPCMAISRHLIFHPFNATFYRDIERMGGIILPANDPEEITASIQAVRARKALNGTKLLVVDTHEDDFRAFEVKAFTEGCRNHLGIEIIRRSVSELKERAARYDDNAADLELKRWYTEVLNGPGEMTHVHMRQVAKLYLGEREMVNEVGAAGITVEDIGGFLKCSDIMPNVSYGVLTFDGILAAEEGDIEVLTTELMLKIGLGVHPTMSNIYIGYRDQYDSITNCTEYTDEMALADYRLCVADNHVMAAHFSTSGVLPPGMMVESRYNVLEALPGWKGQSMIAATPRLGPVVMMRLAPDASSVHMVPGEVDKLGFGDKNDGLRGRWFIRIPSVRDFISRCLHPHYAIGPQNGRLRVLEILNEKLLQITKC